MSAQKIEQPRYLFLNGLSVPRPVALDTDLTLLPAVCRLGLQDFAALSKNQYEFGVMALLLEAVGSQLKVVGEDGKDLAIKSWNAQWDALLLGALFDRDVACNFQCSDPLEALNRESFVSVTNPYLHGRQIDEEFVPTDADLAWLEDHFSSARELLDKHPFQNAVHCLASYRWHSHPRARLALLWSGIEGLFEIESEVVFRLSLYVSRFLEPDSDERRRELFKAVKTLYKHRSAAVHGSVLKDGVHETVAESVVLLQRLVRQCITSSRTPSVGELAP